MMDIGVIGVGAMGRNHVRVYSELKDIGSVGVFDTNEKAAEAVATQNNAEYFPTLEKLLTSVDAVSLCAPTPLHFGIARTVLEHGVHLLIEKPICASSIEAETLIQEIPGGVTVGVGHIERFNPIVEEISRIMHRPLYIEIKRHNPASSRIEGSSVVEDLMIHDLDLIYNVFFDRPELVCSLGNDDLHSVMLASDSIPIYISASRKSSKKIRMIYIEEEDFTVEGDFMTQEIYVYRKPGQYRLEDERYVQENIIEKVMVNKLEPLKRELQQFISCAMDARPFPVTPQEALDNVRVCERIRAHQGTLL